MSITIKGASSGGVDIVAPASGSDVTLTLPSTTGTVLLTNGDGSSLTGVGVDGIVSTANATAITIDSSENVGIGTPTPARRLHISDTTSGATTGIRLTGANNGSQVIEFADTDDTNVGYIQYDHGLNQLTLRVNDGQRLYIDSSGNLGLSTTPHTGWRSTMNALEMGRGAIAGMTNGLGVELFGNCYRGTSNYHYNGGYAATHYEQDNGLHRWQVSSSGTDNAVISFTEAMRIHNDGNVAIGTTQNGARLLAYTSNNMPGLVVNCTDSTTFSSIVSQISCSRDISNHTYTLLRASNGGGVRMACYDSGNIQNTNNSYGSLSDERIKQDISDASSQWDDIKALKVRKYKLKRAVNKDGVENTPFHLGVIAQELESSNMSGLVDHVKPEKEDTLLHPDFGTWDGLDAGLDDEGNEISEFTPGDKVKSIKYSILYMKSIKALQEAMARIESLESRIETLENT
jgi:hypothetical protein